MKMTVWKQEKAHQHWIAVRTSLILINELRNISKRLVLGVFLEPVLDFLRFQFFHRLLNCLLIPVSRLDLQIKYSFKKKDQSKGDPRTRCPLWLYCVSANPEVSNPAYSSSCLFSRTILEHPPAAHSDCSEGLLLLHSRLVRPLSCTYTHITKRFAGHL